MEQIQVNDPYYTTHKQDYYSTVQLKLPVDISYSIEEDDPVRTFMEVMGGINLRRFFKRPRRGREGYNDTILLKIVLFAYMENIRSLRSIEKACKTDIRFMWLSGGLKPSHMAFQRFISDRLIAEIDLIFYEVIQHLIEKDSINTDVLYIDGTKFEANAHKFTFVWKRAILNYQSNLYTKITKEIQSINTLECFNYEIKSAYSAADLEPIYRDLVFHCLKHDIKFVYGKGTRKSVYQRHYDLIKSYADKLVEYEEHLRICGERNSYSKIDHDATFMHGIFEGRTGNRDKSIEDGLVIFIMPGMHRTSNDSIHLNPKKWEWLKAIAQKTWQDYYNKTGIFKPYYNVQIGVSDEYIMHVGVYQNPTDTKTWIPFFESYKEHFDTLPTKPVADAGYGSYDNYLYCLENGMELYMKYNLYSKEKESQYKKRKYTYKNMEHDHETITSKDGLVYIYSHDTMSTKTDYPCLTQIFKLKDEYMDIREDVKAPKTISYNPILMELQQEAKRNLDSDEGIDLRTKRSIQVEGAFGDIKNNMEYRRIQRRGIKNVENEIYLICIGFNLRKFHNKRYRKLN